MQRYRKTSQSGTEGSNAKKALDIIVAALALSMVVYHVASAYYLIVDPIRHLNIHFGFCLLLVFLVALKKAKGLWPLLLLFILASIVVVVYVHFNCYEMQYRGGFSTTADVIIGTIAIIVAAESTRRAFGTVFVILTGLSFVYLLTGSHLPGIFVTSQFSYYQVISRVCASMEGLYGEILGISANYIFLFILFGSVLQTSGATRFFMQIGRIFSRGLAGGGALAAVVTSCLMGMVTGSIGANVATTGSFTIPLMKRMGYKPEQAGAIEAAASTGGQIMPPVMGAAAFLISGFLGISYLKVMLVALVPALLYFFCVGLYVQLQAAKMGLTSPREQVSIRELLLSSPLFIVPLTLLIVLLAQGHSLAYSMSPALGSVIILPLIRKETRPSLREWVHGFTEGAIRGAGIGVSCALIGVLVGALEMGGLVVKLPAAIQWLSHGYLWVGIGYTAIIAIILGLGMPTTAVYILTAVLAGPGLIRMGLPPLTAHLFAFYFGVMGSLTPPVAIAALVASQMAGTTYLRCAVECAKVGIGGFIVPFFFVSVPILLLQYQEPIGAVVGIIACIVTIVTLQAGITGYYLLSLSSAERATFFVAALTLLASVITSDHSIFAAGMSIFALAVIWQWRKRRKLGSRPEGVLAI
ncbi:MAG: TRAP transporter fused permease subunit [Deltaproteobacteria bacterium]|nr:MAG: TRAP transporter fused permease subunit [Deltaproteobacteria bacterium]